MNSYYIQPGIGDTLYCLPVLEMLNSEPFHIVTGLPYHYYKALAPLLLRQKYIAGVSHISEGFGKGLVDFNHFRNVKPSGYMHICERVAKATGINLPKDNYVNGWLTPYSISTERYAVVSHTDRYRDHLYSWHDELYRLKTTYGTVYFIGDLVAWKAFTAIYGRSYCTYRKTTDMNEAAELIANAQEVSTTQTSTLAICQALPGRTYNFERSPTLDTVTLFTERETILNNFTRKLCSVSNRVSNLIKLVKTK